MLTRFSIRKKERGLYESKATPSLAFIQRLCHKSHNCKMVYFGFDFGFTRI